MKREDVLTEKGREILLKMSKEDLVNIIQDLTIICRLDKHILETYGIKI